MRLHLRSIVDAVVMSLLERDPLRRLKAARQVVDGLRAIQGAPVTLTKR